MTPKSLLRHKLCTSSLAEMGPGSSFHRVMYEQPPSQADRDVTRVVLCSGKVYYDLVARRQELALEQVVALLRLEQLAPFPDEILAEELVRFPRRAQVVWCQEEPRNMGGWTFVAPRIEAVLERVGHAPYAPDLRRPAAGRVAGDGALRPARARADQPLGDGAHRRSCRGCGHRLSANGTERAMSVEIRVPSLGESVTEATVAKWFKQVGDPVNADEPIVELETDKVTLEFNAPASGTLAEIVVEEGGEVEVGALLGSIAQDGAADAAGSARPAAVPERAAAPAAEAAGANGHGALSPAVRKLLEEHGLDPATIPAIRPQGQPHQG